jgi:hypothetical protein
MDEQKLKVILEAEIDDAIGYVETETVEQRTKAINYYNRYEYGNEVEGRSKIVTGEVAEVVDGALPQLMRIFVGSDELGRFEPRMPGDEEFAKQATELTNYVFFSDNDGVILMHNWMKDALLQKNGIVKYWWEDSEDPTKEEYKGLNAEELTLMFADDEMELVSQETEEVGIDPMGMPILSYNVVIKKKKDVGRVCVENVPPEEFLIAKRDKSIKNAKFVAHRTVKTRSDLIAMGYPQDKVDKMPAYNDLTYTPERVARYSAGEMPDETQSLDFTMQEVELFECYIRTDFDGDGIAELRKVVYAGNQIIDNEEIDHIPFASICPIPMPHKFFGQSLADRAMDIQLIKSTITRQILDNLYLTNMPRVTALDGQVNLDDLLTSSPGGVVRIKSQGAVQPLSIPATASQSFPMLDYMDQVLQKRSGVTSTSQGIDPNILQNTTATAIAAMQQAGSGRIEMIARIFADTGVKDLFAGIFHLILKYQDKPRVIRLRGKYVSIDPREWKNNYDVTVNVGLGTGNQDQKMAMAAMVMQKQEQILQTQGFANPLVSVGQYRNTLGKFIEAAGYKDSMEFFKEIPVELDQQLSQPQQPMMPPEMATAQVYAQVEQMKAEYKAQADMAKMQIEEVKLQSAREKALAELALEQAKIEMDREKSIVQLQLQQAKVITDAVNAKGELAIKERQQLINELEKTQQMLVDRKEKGDMASAVTTLGEMIGQLQQNQNNLARAMTAPKTVVRDNNGKIIGMKAGE